MEEQQPCLYVMVDQNGSCHSFALLSLSFNPVTFRFVPVLNVANCCFQLYILNGTTFHVNTRDFNYEDNSTIVIYVIFWIMCFELQSERKAENVIACLQKIVYGLRA